MLATFRIGGVVEWSTSKSGGLTGLESITGQSRLEFLAQIENFRDGHLHPKCGFKRLKTGLEVLIGASGGQVIRIEFGQKFQFEPLLVLGHLGAMLLIDPFGAKGVDGIWERLEGPPWLHPCLESSNSPPLDLVPEWHS